MTTELQIPSLNDHVITSAVWSHDAAKLEVKYQPLLERADWFNIDVAAEKYVVETDELCSQVCLCTPECVHTSTLRD